MRIRVTAPLAVAFLLGCQAPPNQTPTRPAAPPDVITLDDPPLTFRRISPARYGFADAPDYFMLETEVTNETFARYLATTGAKKGDEEITGAIDAKHEEERRTGVHTRTTGDPSYSADHRELIWNGNAPPVGKASYPVALVNPAQATAFCKWLTDRHPGLGTFRLPSKTEWLIAAYGRDRKYPWGDEPDDARFRRSPYGDYRTRSEVRSKAFGDAIGARIKAGLPFDDVVPTNPPGESPEPVTARPAGRTPEGLYAMWGNVSELVLPDEWKRGQHVIGLGATWMGGGFDDTDYTPRQDYWGYTHNPDVRQESIGFRVCLDPTPNGRGNQPLAPADAKQPSIYGHPDEWPHPTHWPPAK
jgi:formylglycine-generating enzyme required for sulfatase activity